MSGRSRAGRVDVVGADGTGLRRAPSDLLADLLAGNRRFVRGQARQHPARPGQNRQRLPRVAVLTCMDGRVPLEAAFDQDVGDLCAIRSAAHVLDRGALGSLELAVTVLGVDLVLVLGHTRCAAVQAAITQVRTGQGPGGVAAYVTAQVAPAVPEAGDDASEPQVVRAHVRRTVASLGRSTWLPQGDRSALAGAVYDLDTGQVALVD